MTKKPHSKPPKPCPPFDWCTPVGASEKLFEKINASLKGAESLRASYQGHPFGESVQNYRQKVEKEVRDALEESTKENLFKEKLFADFRVRFPCAKKY